MTIPHADKRPPALFSSISREEFEPKLAGYDRRTRDFEIELERREVERRKAEAAEAERELAARLEA